MPTGRRSLTKTCGKAALPVFLTTSVKVTLVPGEPAVGLAVLVTNILASWAWTSAEELEVTFWPFVGLPETSTLLVRVLVPVMEMSILATICNDLSPPGNMGPMSDQLTFWPALVLPDDDET